MIDDAVFLDAWEGLCRRFARAMDAQEARAYHAFLTERMDTDEFRWAAEVVWSSREFFPRPVDFLLVAPMGEWGRIMELVLGTGGGTAEEWATLTPRTRKALRAVGGSDAVRKDVTRARRAFEQALADTLAQDTGERMGALPGPEGRQVSLLGGGTSHQARRSASEPTEVSSVLRFPIGGPSDPP